jgi:DNA repair protein SbcC/Rad50
MRIKKIHIIKYGPINSLELDINPGLQVIMGPNESGKTLTIDAVIKMLLEGKTRDFEHIDRVSQEPEGYILFEDNEGNEQKVDIRKGLERHMDLGGMDLRNIFIIRDSDLTLRDECGYFRNITDKLTGLRLEQIEDIMSYIQDFGRLVNPSSDSRLSNDKKYGKISQLRTLAGDFSREAEEYIEVSEDKKLDYLELEQLTARQKINSIRKDIKENQRALQWQEYRKNSSSLRSLRDRWKIYKDHKDFSQTKYEKISELIINIDSLGSRISRTASDQEKNIKQRTGLEEKLAQVQGKLDSLESKKALIDRMKAELEIYNRRKAEEVKEPETFSRVITVILLLLAPLSFPAVYIPTGSLPYSFIMPLLLLIAGLVVFIVNRAGIKADHFAAEEKLLENEFRKIGFRIKGLEEVLPEAAAFDDGYRGKAGERDRLADQVRLLEMDDKKLSAELEDAIRDKKSYELELEEIMGSLGIRDINQFNEKRRLRNRAASEIMSLARSLMEMPGGDIPGYDPDRDLGEMAEGLGDAISTWEDKLSGLRPDGDPVPEDEEAGKERLEDLRTELEALEEKEGRLKIGLEEHRGNLNRFQGKFAALDLPRHLERLGPFEITNLERLREAVSHCNRFVGLIDRQQNLAAEAIRIFEDIKNTEETKVSELFEKLKISDIFADITGGKYKDVRFDSQAGEVTVTDAGGNTLNAEKLSKGAYDQLFLSIRIAISEEILGEGRGFFIIDDAFLSSDSRRLENQFKVLKKLADKGWSIVYFSVKDEIAGISRKYTVNKAIEMK